MPEEINRIVTDSIANLLLVSEPVGVDNLVREGHSLDDIKLVGNVMIDSLFYMLEQATNLAEAEQLGLLPNQYGVVTMHRPSNVDDQKTLTTLVDVLVEMSADIPLVFPVHPRTGNALTRAGLAPEWKRRRIFTCSTR